MFDISGNTEGTTYSVLCIFTNQKFFCKIQMKNCFIKEICINKNEPSNAMNFSAEHVLIAALYVAFFVQV